MNSSFIIPATQCIEISFTPFLSFFIGVIIGVIITIVFTTFRLSWGKD